MVMLSKPLKPRRLTGKPTSYQRRSSSKASAVFQMKLFAELILIFNRLKLLAQQVLQLWIFLMPKKPQKFITLIAGLDVLWLDNNLIS